MFKIKGQGKRDSFHKKYLKESSGNVYLLEYLEDGIYAAYNCSLVVVNTNLTFNTISYYVNRDDWKIVKGFDDETGI